MACHGADHGDVCRADGRGFRVLRVRGGACRFALGYGCADGRELIRRGNARRSPRLLPSRIPRRAHLRADDGVRADVPQPCRIDDGIRCVDGVSASGATGSVGAADQVHLIPHRLLHSSRLRLFIRPVRRVR